MLNKTDFYFLTIAEEGNLNTAAQKLYVSQPSLSKYIQRLEHQLGTKLFDRSCSPMKLNEAGNLYLRHLMDSMEQEKQLLDQLQEIDGEIRGTLRLGIPPFCGQCYLPKVLPTFAKAFPHVSIALHEGMGASIEHALSSRKLDLAILPHPISSEDFSCQPLLREAVLLVTKRTEGPVSAPSQIIVQPGKQEHFAGKPTILPHPSQKISAIIAEYFSAIGYQPAVYTRTQNVTTTLALVAAGIGIGFVPYAGLDTISEDIIRNLSFYTLAPDMADLQFVSVTRKGAPVSAYTRRFLEIFRNSAAR